MLTVTPIGTATPSAIKNGTTALTVTTDYTYSSGTLTILYTYLDALDNGDYTINIIMTDGGNASAVITVED